MKALITGASGFVGTCLMEYLGKQGIEVFTLGRSNVAASKQHYDLKSSWKKETLLELIKNIQPDYFFHLAGSSQTIDLKQAFTINACLSAFIFQLLKDDRAQVH